MSILAKSAFPKLGPSSTACFSLERSLRHLHLTPFNEMNGSRLITLDLPRELCSTRCMQALCYSWKLTGSDSFLIFRDVRKSMQVDESQLHLLLEVFEALDDQDGFNGASRLSSATMSSRSYRVNGDWNRLFQSEQSKCMDEKHSRVNIEAAMSNLGYYELILGYSIGCLSQKEVPPGAEESEYLFEALWRNGQWTLPQLSCEIGNFVSLR